jgi:hypothetical protein
VLETPYAGDVEANLHYARLCMADCLKRGEAPFASHLLYTQPGVLDDTDPEERKLGIEAGFLWAKSLTDGVDLRVVYVDRGISGGMQQGIDHGKALKQTIVYRKLPGYVT